MIPLHFRHWTLPSAVLTPVDDGPYFFNVNLPTMVSLSDWRESLHFTSFVSVWLFHFLSGSFQAVNTESMYSGPTISCVNHVEHWSFICPKHAFMPCRIAAQLICSARVLHFSASSLLKANGIISFMLALKYTDFVLVFLNKDHSDNKSQRSFKWGSVEMTNQFI